MRLFIAISGLKQEVTFSYTGTGGSEEKDLKYQPHAQAQQNKFINEGKYKHREKGQMHNLPHNKQIILFTLTYEGEFADFPQQTT